MGADARSSGVVSLVSRLWGISYPADQLFDEAYYPPEAHELLTWGFEYNRGYSFIVHPPLGKWLIALGEQLFGYDSFGWRFPSAVAGAVAVVVLTRLARRLTGSTLLGLLAGLLLALDGFSFSLVADRPARRLPAGVRRRRGRLPGRRPRRRPGADPGDGRRRRRSGSARAAGGSRPAFLFGCACAVKWSGVWFLAFFAVLSLFWDRAAWREAGVPRPTRTTLRRGAARARCGRWAPSRCSPTWRRFTGWFLGETSQGKAWAQQHPRHRVPVRPRRAALAVARARPVADVPQRPVDPAPLGVRALVVAGRRPADPAVEPAGAHRRRRRRRSSATS